MSTPRRVSTRISYQILLDGRNGDVSVWWNVSAWITSPTLPLTSGRGNIDFLISSSNFAVEPDCGTRVWCLKVFRYLGQPPSKSHTQCQSPDCATSRSETSTSCDGSASLCRDPRLILSSSQTVECRRKPPRQLTTSKRATTRVAKRSLNQAQRPPSTAERGRGLKIECRCSNSARPATTEGNRPRNL